MLVTWLRHRPVGIVLLVENIALVSSRKAHSSTSPADMSLRYAHDVWCLDVVQVISGECCSLLTVIELGEDGLLV